MPGDRIFENNEVRLLEMLDLYEKGASASSLARKYDCDHSTILNQVRKHDLIRGIVKPAKEYLYKMPSTVIPKTEKDYADHLRVDPYKHYKEILARFNIPFSLPRTPKSVMDSLPEF